jgi:hypothetical protein
MKPGGVAAVYAETSEGLMMDQGEFQGQRQDGWLARLFRMLSGGGGNAQEVNYSLPSDSMFSGFLGGGQSLADVPEEMKEKIREEAVLSVFNRLSSPLRLLLYATEPGKEPPTAEEFQQILSVWRCELQDSVNLKPDGYPGAIQPYQPEMEAAYTIAGRCTNGDLLRVTVPCWRLFGQVVVRGEAEKVDSPAGGNGGVPDSALQWEDPEWAQDMRPGAEARAEEPTDAAVD